MSSYDLFIDSNQLCKTIIKTLDNVESSTGNEIDTIIELAKSMTAKYFTVKK